MTAALTSIPDTQAIHETVAQLRVPAVDMLRELVGEASLLGEEASAQRLMAQRFRQLGLRVDEFEIDELGIRDHPGYSCGVNGR